MIDFPIGELMDEAVSLQWLEHHLYPASLCCPRCGSRRYRTFQPKHAFPGYRCRDCDGAFTILTGTAFEKTRQKPSTVVVFLRGVAQGETTARVSRELSLSYKQALTLRHRVQDNANETAPLGLMQGQHFEADEVYVHAGKKSDRHPCLEDPPGAGRTSNRGMAPSPLTARPSSRW